MDSEEGPEAPTTRSAQSQAESRLTSDPEGGTGAHYEVASVDRAMQHMLSPGQQPAQELDSSTATGVDPAAANPSQAQVNRLMPVAPTAQPAAEQIGQLQAELAAVRQSLATYETTLQLLVSELGTQTLPAVIQQLQQRPQQAQDPQQQLPSTPQLDVQQDVHMAGGSGGQAQDAGSAADSQVQSPVAGGPSAAQLEAAPATLMHSAAPGVDVSRPSAVASPAGPDAAYFQQLETGAPQQQQEQEQQAEQASAHQPPGTPVDERLGPFWQQQQQWEQVPSAPVPTGLPPSSGYGSLYAQQHGEVLHMRHSEPLPITGQQRSVYTPRALPTQSQLGSSFGSVVGTFGGSFSGADEPLSSVRSAGGSGAGLAQHAPRGRTSLSPARQQQMQQQQRPPSPLGSGLHRPPLPGAALSESSSSFDFLRQGFSGLVPRGAVTLEQQPQVTTAGALPPMPSATVLHEAAAFGSSGRGHAAAPGSSAVEAAAAELSFRPGSASAGQGSAAAAAAAALHSSLSQSQHLSSSLGPAGALAAGSGLTLPVLAQGAQLMGLLPPLPAGSSSGAGGLRQGYGPFSSTLTPSPGGSLEGPSGLLMQDSSSAASTAPMQQPLPPPSIIHHLLTDTAGSLDLMSSLSPSAAGFATPHSSAAAAAAAAAVVAAAAGYNSSFGSEHSIGSFGLMSGGLSGSLPVSQVHGTAGLEHDAVPGSRSIDQYSTQQLAALQGFLQQHAAAAGQDPAAAAAAAAAAASGDSMDPLAVLQQLQAQAVYSAAGQQAAQQELLPGMPSFAGSAEQQQQQAVIAALSQLGAKDPGRAAVAAAAAAALAAAGRSGGAAGSLGLDPAAALAAAAAAAGNDPSGQASGMQAQQVAQLQAALANMNLQAQAQMEFQAMQQAQFVQQLQQHYSAQQLLVAQAAAAAATTAALRQQQSSGWHGDRRLSNAVAAGKLLGHGSGGSTGSSGGRRSSRGGDALSGSRDSRKASSTGERSARVSLGGLPDYRRIFVGNIGWWVDEDMLQRVFGEYGTILDAQVMWNTKLLAKGKRVNREFAFISYSSPEEAGNAIRIMQGRYIEGLTKDRDGLTVQYEAQGVGKVTSQPQPQQHPQQGFAPPAATQQHFLLHQLQQQQQQQQGALQALLQEQQGQAGMMQNLGELNQHQQQQQQQSSAAQLSSGAASRLGAGDASTSTGPPPNGPRP